MREVILKPDGDSARRAPYHRRAPWQGRSNVLAMELVRQDSAMWNEQLRTRSRPSFAESAEAGIGARHVLLVGAAQRPTFCDLAEGRALIMVKASANPAG
jgi:hypothetical protein